MFLCSNCMWFNDIDYLLREFYCYQVLQNYAFTKQNYYLCWLYLCCGQMQEQKWFRFYIVYMTYWFHLNFNYNCILECCNLLYILLLLLWWLECIFHFTEVFHRLSVNTWSVHFCTKVYKNYYVFVMQSIDLLAHSAVFTWKL